MRADRLIGILLELDRNEQVTAPELARKFEADVRTIYRDMNALSLDFPIRSKIGPEGGYSFMDDYKLPRLPFSKKEVAALTLMGSVAGQKLGLIEGDVFRTAFLNLLSSLPETYQAESRWVSERILIDIEPWRTPPKTPQIVDKVKQALYKNLVLEFQYQKGKGKIAKQRVEPYGLCFRSGFHYLVGYSQKRRDYRLFRTDRFSRLKVTEEKFNRDPKFSLDRYWYKDLPKQYRDKGSEVKIVFDSSVANEIKKTKWGGGVIKNLKDGRLELTFRTFDFSRLVSFVLSFGPKAQLIEPKKLKGEIKKSLEETLIRYK